MEWKPTDKLLLIPGVRFDYYKELLYDGPILPEFWDYGFDNSGFISGDPSFRLNGRYKLTGKHTLKGAVGNYSQIPQPLAQVNDKELGNPFIPSTKASHYVLGHEWQTAEQEAQ